jgi:hypothetical protein
MRQVLEYTITKFVKEIKKMVEQGAKARNARQVLEIEQSLLALVRKLGGDIMGLLLKEIVETEDPAWHEPVIKAFKEGPKKRLRDGGSKEVTIKTLGGTEVTLRTKYLAPKKYKHPGRKRRLRQRGRDGTGLYPVLVSLGITHGCTPALLSEVSRQAVASDSIEEARSNLGRLGVEMDIKTVWRIGRVFARDCLEVRDQRLASAGEGDPDEIQNRRVVLCVDGGRVRTRRPHRRGRIPAGKKRRGFDTPWREPKLLVLYCIDSEGKRDPSMPPIIDGTLAEADALIALVVGYLRLMGAKQAAELIVIGDGARWIWERIPAIVEGAGIEPKRVTAIVDFYHAVGHLQKVADLKTGWSEKKRRRWVNRQRALLRRGKAHEVIASIRCLGHGRKAKAILTELRYFQKNSSRMKYARFKRRGLPIGSGAVESCIRRVVNLRMKGPGIFWLKENAEGFLHLRCLLKSGRWETSFMQTLDFQAMRAAA